VKVRYHGRPVSTPDREPELWPSPRAPLPRKRLIRLRCPDSMCGNAVEVEWDNPAAWCSVHQGRRMVEAES
jgi:hypothetical protein